MGWAHYLKLAYLSKESSDRRLFRLVKRQRASRVVELGIGSLERTCEMIKLAGGCSSGAVQYTGFDAFDERGEGLGRLSLIEAHRACSAAGAAVRLMPGGPVAGLGGLANSLRDTDLVLISSLAVEASLEPLWFYLPRMCRPGTLVMRQQPAGGVRGDWSPIGLEEVSRRAEAVRVAA